MNVFKELRNVVESEDLIVRLELLSEWKKRWLEVYGGNIRFTSEQQNQDNFNELKTEAITKISNSFADVLFKECAIESEPLLVPDKDETEVKYYILTILNTPKESNE